MRSIAGGRRKGRALAMEAVKAFNQELSSLYELKPPISKARMTSITKSAIKAIKFYKHVVQSVEKFIQKCRPEFKIPGLYVIDSIVRQSRHQGRKRQLDQSHSFLSILCSLVHNFSNPRHIGHSFSALFKPLQIS